MIKINNDKILIELIENQKKNITNVKKLTYNDFKRISKYLTTSIFNSNCSIWNGYITTIKNNNTSLYINFYYNGKKYSLHRLLYINYVGELLDSEYIKFSCPNKGKCCNINHFYKINNIDTTICIPICKPTACDSTISEPTKSIPNTKITNIVNFNL